LEFEVGNNNVCFNISGLPSGVFYDLEDNIDKGSKEITASNLGNYFSVGDWIRLTEYDFPVTIGFEECIGQITRIENIVGNTAILKDDASKYYNDDDYHLKIKKIYPVTNVGIENLKIKRLDTGSAKPGSNISFEYAVNCWVRGIESEKTSQHHVNIAYSSNIEVSGCNFVDANSREDGGFGYGVILELSTNYCLVENNLFQYLRHSMAVQGGANANVFTYNYSRDPKDGYDDLTLHGNYPYSNLFEGNFVEKIEADDTHLNNGPFNLFIRNRAHVEGESDDNTIILYNSTKIGLLGCQLSFLGIIADPWDFSEEFYGFKNGNKHHHSLLHDVIREDCHLEDLSYYYDDRPYFFPDIQFPSIGPKHFPGGTHPPQTNPARERRNQSVKTYITKLTQWPTPRLAPTIRNVPSSSGSTTFELTNNGYCNNMQWTASHNAPWASISPTSGTLSQGQTQVITVSYGQNTDLLDRSCTLTVSYFDRSEEAILYQYGKPTTSGTLSCDETWRENVTLTGDLTIPSGKTLTITAGQTITLPNYTEIYVSGTLTAQGTENNPIIFQSQSGIPGNSNNTYLIRFNNASSSGSSLEYCELKNAYRGIYLYYSGAAVRHSRFEGFYYGIYANRTSNTPLIEYNQFTGCSYGIYQYYTYSYSSIKNNTMNCSSYGIYNYRSSPAIYSNEMYGAAFGIRCDSYSSPQMSSYSQPGNNIIHDHFMAGMYVTDNSNPFLGSDYCLMDGHNSFENNEEGQITAGTNCSVVAEKNWWGTPTPPAWFFSGNVDYIPYLTSPPFMGMSAPPEELAFDADFGSSVPGDEDPASDIMAYYDEDWNLTQKTRFAHALIYNGEPESAQQICKDIIETCPDSAKAFYALDLLWQASRMEGVEKSCDEEAFITYLNNLTQNKEHKELYGSAELLLAGFEGKDGLSRMDYVFETYRQSYLAEAALFQKFMYYLNDLEDVETAKKISNQLYEFFPESPSALQAQHLLGDEKALGYKSQMAKSPDSYDWSTDHSIPEKYALLGAYPNPFNPSTSIRYHLPKDSKLQIVLYNTLGQVVFKEVIPNQPAGRHAYTWSGRDERNQLLPSGLYIVRFSAEALDGSLESFEKALKLTLIR
jgi:parallel beta-helix repeat protein